MNTSDEKLNQLLNSVKPVPPRRDLAQRIIAQSNIEMSQLSSIKEQGANKDGFLKQILHSFIIPKPAYALACSMLLGLLLGWQNSDMTQFNYSLDIDGSMSGEIENVLHTTSVEEDLSSLFLAEVNYYE